MSDLSTKAGQQGGALATAPYASTGATTPTGMLPWVLLAGVVYRYQQRLVAVL